MKAVFSCLLYLIFTSAFILLFGCNSTKKIPFETPVDTSSKKINFQTKQTYKLKDIGVYANNEFDGARLNGFKKLNDSTALVIINPENTPINNSSYYAFKTWRDIPGPFYLRFQYPEGFKHRYIPKLKVNNEWVCIDSTHVYGDSIRKTILVNLTTEPLLIAAQEIQSSKDVQKWYTSLVRGKEDHVKLNIYGKSILEKNLPVLDMYKGTKKHKDVIVLFTRQHPPEVTGYFAFQSFVETLLNDDFQLSNEFLNKYRILAFPILNPDGVDLGHWRHNAGGVDTNRDWSAYRQPEIKQTVTFISKALKSSNSKLILGLDFHSTWYDIFYTNKTRDDTALPHFLDDWFAALEHNIPDYKVNEKAGNSKKPVSKGWLLYGHNATGLTYEIGDDTPRDQIKLIGKTTAEQMMRILLNR